MTVKIIEGETEMSRAIDADALCDWLKEYGQEYIHGKKKISLMYIWKHIQDTPTIAPERKRGRWIQTRHFGCMYRMCSNCSAERKDDLSTGWNFCPNCGADMRGEQNEAD